ncbi:hypothetical protein N7537_006565 [Penicillium hordei]|uniref:Uncharacterized protein n=1 Tax=Penicillium hordei TaxID=40994 RepID=A0AAD6H5B4_9EURO|nr:uncharacterized protein N7537_006565 [Penicillium hordei]KAJ5603609.1 hypothetical protein N7537_006565 [Penicillium hordei]
MSLFLCCTGLGTTVQTKVHGTLGRVWRDSVVRVSDTYFLARNRNSISLFLDLVSLALAYLHYLSYSSPLFRLTSS